jgi:hypothetical protein
MSIIQKTTNYTQFTNFKSNRKVHPEKLIESIKKKNMLESHPILVTKDKKVIDGQHRLRAAAELKLPIYFTIIEDLDEQHIPLCQVQRPWKLEEFLHFYKDHNDDYKFVYECIHEFKLPPHFVIQICHTDMRKSFIAFRMGDLRITKDKEKLKNKFELFAEIRYACQKIVKFDISRSFSDAVWKIMDIKEDDEHGAYNQDIFLHKIDIYREVLIDTCKYKSTNAIYENLVEKIYNRNAKDKKKTLKFERPKIHLRKFKNSLAQC